MSTTVAPNAGTDRQSQQLNTYDPGHYAVDDNEGAELDKTVTRPLPYDQQLVHYNFRRYAASSPPQPYGTPDELTLNCPPDGEIRVMYALQPPPPPRPPSDGAGLDVASLFLTNAASVNAMEYHKEQRKAGEMDRKYELLWKLMVHRAIERCVHVEFEPTLAETIVVLEGMSRGRSLADELSRRRSQPNTQPASQNPMATMLTLASQLALSVVSACHYLHAHNILVSPIAILPQFVLVSSDGRFQLRNGLRLLDECPAAKTIIMASSAAFQLGSSGDDGVATAASNACVAYMLAPAVRYRSEEWIALRRFAGLLKMAVLRMVVKLLHVAVCEKETDATAEVPSAKATLAQLHKVLEKVGLEPDQHKPQAVPTVSADTNIIAEARRREAAIMRQLATFVQRTCDTSHDPPEVESFSFGPLLTGMLLAAKGA